MIRLGENRQQRIVVVVVVVVAGLTLCIYYTTILIKCFLSLGVEGTELQFVYMSCIHITMCVFHLPSVLCLIKLLQYCTLEIVVELIKKYCVLLASFSVY